MKIFILNPVAGAVNAEFIQKLEQYGDAAFEENIKPILEVDGILESGDKIIAIDPDFSDWKFTADEIKQVPDLKAIVLDSTSFSWVDTDAAAELGVPVVNTRNFSTNAVAEWAVMMALNVYRKVPLLIKGGFKMDYVLHQGLELKGKKAAVIGLGDIGTRIAEIAQGLGMEVVYWSKNTRDDRFEFESVEEIMRTADVIFPAVAQNDETNGLISDEMLKSMKPEAMFITIVHHVYNHDLLLELTAEGKIYGYGFEDKAEKFNDYEGNVWAAPELAWCTKESFERNADLWLKNIIAAAEGDYSGRVN